ncbi:hypothetical protein R0K20_13195, partial [Staphylococcus sp. SIMBA_130]
AKQTLFLKIEPHHESVLSEVKKVLYQHSGDTEVVIYYSKTDKTVKLGEEWLVNPDSDCVHTLKKLLGERNVVKKPR